ncbi:MAG: dienelactone hydrolase family protein [Planctomycetota bacterium]
MKHVFAAALLVCATAVFAEVKVDTIEYKDGDVVCEGYLAYDPSVTTPRPGVVIVHDWMGNGPFSKKKAEDVAALGYVAFAADIYGKGNRATNAGEASQLAGKYKGDRATLRKRVNAALTALIATGKVDAKKVASMGFCFGGTTALELARSGADVLGTVSFHGGLSTPTPADAKNIKGKLLILHGADDPFVKKEEVDAFKKEVGDVKVPFHFVEYVGAVHSFTNKAAGTDNSKGAAYNEAADTASWAEMKKFFADVLK